jgi:hypothetical protein
MENCMKKSKLLQIAAVCGLMLSGCDGGGSIQPDQNREGVPIRLTVHWAQNDAELAELWKERTGNTGDIPDQWGFAQWNQAVVGGAEPAEYWCDVFVLRPRSANDARMDALGHEVAHCVWGSWHPSP